MIDPTGRDLLGEYAVRLRETQLRYERACDAYNTAAFIANDALDDLRTSAEQLSKQASRIIDELVLPHEVVS